MLYKQLKILELKSHHIYKKIEKKIYLLSLSKMPTVKVKSFDRTINPGGGVPRTVTVKSHERHIKSPEKPGK